MKKALLSLLATAILAGCTTKTPPPTPPPPAKTVVIEDRAYAPTPVPNEAESKEVVVRYFNAVVNNDLPTIDYLWHTSRATKAPTPTGTKEAVFKELTLNHMGLENGVMTAFYTIKFDLGVNSFGACEPGVNTRWAVLQNQNGGWKINPMTTSPHP